jgi:hypothetical protein
MYGAEATAHASKGKALRAKIQPVRALLSEHDGFSLVPLAQSENCCLLPTYPLTEPASRPRTK